MMSSLISCVRCKRFFQPTGEKQCICENCENNNASKSVLILWIAFTGSVIGLLLYMLIK